jgi:NAD(P)-dependent dehydrogenase (short-subunit alcohol dehydrogenase family)
MTGTVILITGATDGLGKALAVKLSQRPETRLILHGRNSARLDLLARELTAVAAEIVTVQADFAQLAQVHELADRVAEVTDYLSVLVNNAGVGAGEPDGDDRRLTVDGNELRFAVNYLAPFALTQRLLPLLDRGAPARVVNVASIGQSPIALDDLTLQQGYTGQRAYGVSKLALITSGMTLAARLAPAKITVNSLHPATFMPTKMVLDSIGYSIDSLDAGLRSTERLILAPDLAGVTGRFFDQATEARALPDAYSPQVRERLWAVSETLTQRT